MSKPVLNACDACGVELTDTTTALCYPCADAAWDRWLDKHDDIGSDE